MKAIYRFFWLKLEKICKNEARWERISIDKYVNGEAKYVQVPCSFLMKKKDNKIAPQRQKKNNSVCFIANTGLEHLPSKTLWSRLKGQGRFLIYKHKKNMTSLKASLTYQPITVKKLNILHQSNAVLWSEKATCKTIKRTSDKVLKKNTIIRWLICNDQTAKPPELNGRLIRSRLS